MINISPGKALTTHVCRKMCSVKLCAEGQAKGMILREKKKTCLLHMLSCFSRVWLFATLWTVACQAPLFMRFSRQEYWNGLPFPSQGIFLSQGLNPSLLSLLHCTHVLCHWATREALYGEEAWRILSSIPPASLWHLQWKTMAKDWAFSQGSNLGTVVIQGGMNV